MMSLEQAVILFVLATAQLAHHCNGEDKVHYVRPDNGSNMTCPGQPCELLDYYAGLTNYSNNTSFIFIPGLHTLSKTFRVVNEKKIKFMGMSDLAIIQCNTTAGFIFENITSLNINSVQISLCGRNVPYDIYNATDFPVHAAIALKNVVTLTMNSTIIQDCSGYGIFVDGLYGNSILDNCTLVNNTGRDDEYGTYRGGNLFIRNEKCPLKYTQNNITLSISESKFLKGNSYVRKYRKFAQIWATGITLLYYCTTAQIILSGLTLDSNEAHSWISKGGNLHIAVGSYKPVDNYTSSSILVENTIINHGKADLGGGVYLFFFAPTDKNSLNQTCRNRNIAIFRNTTFEQNAGKTRGGAMYVSFVTNNNKNACPKVTLELENCNFKKNILSSFSANSGVAINAYTYIFNGIKILVFPSIKVNITGCNFLSNGLLLPYNNKLLASGQSTLYIANQARETFVSDSRFINNGITAITAFNSAIVFSGNVIIRNNSGLDGGGLVLCQSSYILFAPNTTVTFEQNKATLSGGGIYAEDRCLQSEPLCFYQVYSNNINNSTKTQKHSILNSIKVIMINNTAGYAGSQIFGGSMDYCETYFIQNSTFVYEKIFNDSLWTLNKSDLSNVTSYPKHICFCDVDFNIKCENKAVIRTVYPGQSFNVSLVAVGQFNHPVPGTIVANVSNTNLFYKSIKAKCTNITLTVLSSKLNLSEDIVNVLVENQAGSFSRFYNRLKSIQLKYQKCPLGTKIKNKVCYWSGKVSYYNTNNQTITKPGLVWVGYYNTSLYDISIIESDLIEFQYCPQLYCDYHVTFISINETSLDQDKQCRDHRTGIVCGACKSPYSLAIGSTKCVNCIKTYWYAFLALLGAVLIAIIALLFMFGCNFTTTDGTLNGFLFYSSMFHINKELFLRAETSTTISNLFTWLNMGIGFSICFYDGFDAFGQVILNFTVPLIVWLGLGLLIFISSKSIRVTRLIGNHTVKVLATVILLSYTTIIQTEITVFSCSAIYYGSDNQIAKHHWLADGNVLCWQGKHLVLVVIGVLFGVATVLYTLTLLFIQPLQRYSHVRGLRWVAKLKPFFDAYTSPHVIKPCYRFWTGFLLLCRLFVSLLFAYYSRENQYGHYEVVLTFVCIVILSLFCFFSGTYTKQWLNVLNASFFANLTILSLLSNYSILKFSEFDGKGTATQNAATYISLTIAFVTLFFIILYHVYKRLNNTRMFACCVARVKKSRWWKWPRTAIGLRGTDYTILQEQSETNDDFSGERQPNEDVHLDDQIYR